MQSGALFQDHDIVPILDRPEERSQSDLFDEHGEDFEFQSSIAPKNDRNLYQRTRRREEKIRFQSSIAPKNDRNCQLLPHPC